MAEMITQQTFVIKVTEKELSLIMKGLGGLLNPELISAKEHELSAVAELNRNLLLTSISQIRQHLHQLEGKLARAEEMEKLVRETG